MRLFSKIYNKIFGAKSKCQSHKNIYMGCGNDSLAGYVGCDIRKTPVVKIVCKAWELSSKVKDIENIYSRHMCEHLTYQEFEQTLKDWHRALRNGGQIHIIVPNIDYHIEQFKRAVFDNKNLQNAKSDLAWSIAGFCGWQRENYTLGGGQNKILGCA